MELTAEAIVELFRKDVKARRELAVLLVSEPDIRLAIINAVLRDVATKGDIEALRAAVKDDIKALKEDVERRFEELRTEFRRDLDSVRREIDALAREIDRFTGW